MSDGCKPEGEHGESVERKLAMLNGRRRPQIGDEIFVYGWDHHEFCDDWDEFDPRGTVIRNGGKVAVEIPRQVIPEQIIPAHTVEVTWSEEHGWFYDGGEVEFEDE